MADYSLQSIVVGNHGYDDDNYIKTGKIQNVDKHMQINNSMI